MPRRQTALWVASILVYAFLYIPLIIVVVFSFNDSKLNLISKILQLAEANVPGEAR